MSYLSLDFSSRASVAALSRNAIVGEKNQLETDEDAAWINHKYSICGNNSLKGPDKS